MSWFDEQIRARKENDEKAFEEAFLDVASAILGDEENQKLDDRFIITKQAIDEILKYYHFKVVDIPENIKDGPGQLEYALMPRGVMHRNVKLTEKWRNDAYGPMIGFLKEDHTPVALLPYGLHGYCYHDFSSGKKIRINGSNEKMFSKEAICFYKPLPQKKLTITDLLLYLKGCLHPRDISLMVVSIFAVAFVGLLSPSLSALITGTVLDSGDVAALFGTAFFLVAASISTWLLTMINNLFTQRITLETDLSVEAAMMMRILSLPASFFKKYTAGELATRASAVSELCNMLVTIIITGQLTSLVSLIYIFEIFHYAPSLVLPSMLIILSTIICMLISTFMQIRVTREILGHEAKENGLSYALISGIQKIRLSGSEKRAFAKWAKGYSHKAKLQYNPATFLKVYSVVLTAIGLFGNVVIYYIALNNGIDASEYIGFTLAYGMTFGAFSQMAALVKSMAMIGPVLDMAKPFLDAEPEMSEEKAEITSVSGNIELSHVSFRYSEAMPYIFDDLSLTIHPGDYICIVGKTGCGKTTLLRLLLGFEKPEKGAIYYDGKDIATIDLKSLRKRIGTVMQTSGLFQGDIFHNIAISNPFISLSDAWEAAEIAGIAEDIRQMPMGMSTFVSEGGGGISGGQRQRIMIARAVAPKPKVLIMDEATSALDNKTQKKVSDALADLKCTRIVIAHRLSTIKNCNRILVIDGGKIVEDGTYDSLIENDGFFKQLVERQMCN